MRVTWIANTNQGRMVGDYTSTSFTGDGKAHPVFSWAKPLDAMRAVRIRPPVRQRLSTATFDITAPPLTPRRKSETGPVYPRIKPKRPARLVTAN